MSRNAFDTCASEIEEREDERYNLKLERTKDAQMTCEHYRPVLPPVIVNRGTCSYCGEEMDLELLDSDHRCPDCVETYEEEDEEHNICSACNGSGEGLYPGTRCHYCYGRGTV